LIVSPNVSQNPEVAVRIFKFSGQKVHGYLNFDVSLFPDITFFNGINGSGKTTVVRSIVALVTPDIGWLVSVDFANISVSFEFEGKQIQISASKAGGELSLKCSEIEHPTLLPLKPLADYFKEPEPSAAWEFAAMKTRRGPPLPTDDPVLSYIERLPTPMFLGLERTARRRDATNIPFGSAGWIYEVRDVLRGSLDNSLSEASDLAQRAYQDIRRKRETLTIELRKNLILSAFAETRGQPIPNKLPPASYGQTLQHNFSSVRKTLLALNIAQHDIDRSISPFLDRIQKLFDKIPHGRPMSEFLGRPSAARAAEQEAARPDVLAWLQAQPQVQRIMDVSALIEEFNKKVEQLEEPIQNYKKLVNRFLNDSKKSIDFSTDEKVIARLPDQTTRPINSLSSGERQIVVILTHLAFNELAKQANVLIIDEPEISLHIRWQEIFVESLKSANPETQIILATHSPSIILDDASHCIDL
jgi:ABC-type Mn2+/Zn2+ transport system ATPase subunit